jgi:hypothetical protein
MSVLISLAALCCASPALHSPRRQNRAPSPCEKAAGRRRSAQIIALGNHRPGCPPRSGPTSRHAWIPATARDSFDRALSSSGSFAVLSEILRAYRACRK